MPCPTGAGPMPSSRLMCPGQETLQVTKTVTGSFRKSCHFGLKVLVQHLCPGRSRNQGVAHDTVSTIDPRGAQEVSRMLAERERLRLRPLVLKGWAISPYHLSSQLLGSPTRCV